MEFRKFINKQNITKSKNQNLYNRLINKAVIKITHYYSAAFQLVR